MSPELIIGGGVLLWWLLGGKKTPPPPPVKAAPPAAKPKGGDAELSNGNFARFEGDVFDEANQTYVGCRGPGGEELPDSACSLVRREFPEIKIPTTALIRMTEGRLL
jgi:hypothetical protein